VGGRLQYFWKEWSARGAHPWVVGMLRWGYQLQFRENPPVARRPTVLSGYTDPAMNLALKESIEALLDKNPVEEVSRTDSRGFYGRLFLRPKASGGWRPILDLKPLNPYILGSRIKQETQARSGLPSDRESGLSP